MSARLRWLASQFARPSGPAGRLLIGPWLDRISRRANRLAIARLAPREGERILEIGFGGGALLALLLEAEPAKLFAADASEAMVRRARRRFSSDVRGGGLDVLHSRVEALPLPDRTLDAAVSVSSLYFWDDLAAAMRELARLLRPGGRLVLVWESPQMLRRWPGHVHGFNAYDAPDLVAAGAAAGLAADRVEREDGFIVLSLRRGADMEAP
jgi:SAM-dependent methyltransferase